MTHMGLSQIMGIVGGREGKEIKEGEMAKPTQSEFYGHCRMFFCMGCIDKGEDEEGCDDCPVSDIPLDPPDRNPYVTAEG